MNLLQAVRKEPALKDTFIEDLFEAMEDGSTYDSMPGVADGEKVIGEMNKLEKALDYLRQRHGKEEEGIISRLREKVGPYNLKKEKKLIVRLKSCQCRRQAAENLMWENILTRFADELAEEDTHLGVRSGHQIVKINSPSSFSCDDPNCACRLLELIMRD